MVSASCDANGVSDPSADFRAVRAYHSGRARPPPLGWALPTVSPAGGGSAPCMLWFLTRRGYLPPAQPPLIVTSPGEKTNLTQKGPFKRVRVYRPALRPSSVAPPRADPDPHRRPAAVEHSSHGVSSSCRGSLRGLRRSSGCAATNPPPKPPVAVPYPAPRAPTPTTHQPPVT